MKITLLGVLIGNERLLERGLGFRPLQITESEGARGIARVCAIFTQNLATAFVRVIMSL